MKKLFLLFTVLSLSILAGASTPEYFDRTSVSLVVSNRTTVSIKDEDKSHLLEMISSANSNCDSTKNDLLIRINLVVNEPYPTTGIPASALVAVFLKKNGVQSIREGQITKNEILSLHPELDFVLVNSIEVWFNCTKVQNAVHA